jgi:hypothetical protein
MTARQRRACSLIVLLASVLSGCGEDPTAAAIVAQVRSGPGHPLVLSELAPFRWDRVCLFGPYTTAQEVVQITGLPEAARATHGIESNESIDLLLFVEGDRIVREVELPRTGGDFAPELLRKCYSRRDAIFAVRVVPENSSGNIAPPLR